MKTIHFRNDFGIIDLTDKADLDEIQDRVDVDNATEIVLDFTGCLIGYETCQLVDFVVTRVSNSCTLKTVTVKNDYRFISKDTLVDWLFRNSALVDWSESSVDGSSKATDYLCTSVLQKYNVNLVVSFL